MKKSIVWLASYPKSGNTWARIFLANYLSNAQKPMSINQVNKFGMGDSITKTYNMVAGRQIDYSNIGIVLSLREKVLRGIVGNNADVNLVKTHNIRGLAYGVDLIPEKFTRSAVYIIRNPLDVVLSYSRHYALSHEETVEAFSRSDNGNAADASTVWQFLGSWTEHVQSWTAKSPYSSLLLRYEDFLETPTESFGKLLDHLGVPIDEDRLMRAIRFSSFDEVSKQEAAGGFGERSPNAEKFFAKGKSGQWQTDLDPTLVDRVSKDHRNTMKRYGYLE